MNEPNPYAAPRAAESVPKARVKYRGPAFRWRTIVVAFCGFIGAVSIFFGFLGIGVLAYFNYTYGPIEYDPEFPRRSELAITWRTVGQLVSTFVVGAISLAVARGAWRKMQEQARPEAAAADSNEAAEG